MSIDAKPWPGGGGAASVPDATETTAGKIRIATSAEATTGTDDTIAMTPLTVKERIDAAVTGGIQYIGTFNATTGLPSIANAEQGDLYKISTGGTIYGRDWAVGDHLIINEDMGGTISNGKIDKVDNTEAVTSVNTLTGAVVLSADDLEGDHAGVNYTGLATDTIDVHLSGIDTALGSVGGNQLVRADIKNVSFNSDRNSFYRIGTDALTMTMPSSGLSEGDVIGVYAVSSNEFDLTVSGNLVTINATSVSSTTIKVNKRSIMLWVYDASTSRWVQTSDSLDTGSSSDAGVFLVATNAEAEAATIVDKVLVPGLMPHVDLSTLDNDLSADDFPADHTGVNYTGLATDTIDVHLSGIDTALGLAGGISAVVDDEAPQLGGPLDVNGQAITSASNGDVAINPDGTGDISIGADIIPDADATHTIGDENNRFITLHSELNGAVQFKARNETGGPLTKGQAVYISGVSGSVPLVSLARANSASTMPAHGLLAADVSNNADVQVVTFGNLTDYNTTTYSLSANDTVYVSSATAGALTNSAPTGEANLIQNIGRVVRADASAGIIKVGGAGRSAATPNLDSGKIFLGDGSNQAVSTALSAINLTSFNDDLGSTYQPLDAQLTDVAGLTPADGAVIIGDGANFITESGATARASLGLTIGTDVQAYDAQLTDVAGLTPADGAFIVGDGVNFVTETLATARTSLGLGTAATSNTGDFLASTATLNDISDVTITGVSNGQVISYNSTSGEWENSTPSSGGATDLDGLSDVTITSVTGGDLLQNNGSGQFVNVAKSTIALSSFNDDLSYQPLDAQLTDVAGLTPADGAFIVGDGANFITESGATARASLGAISEISEDSTPQLGGPLDVNGQAITSASNGDVEITPNGTGFIKLGGNTNPAEVRFFDEAGTNYVALKAPADANISADVTLTLPVNDGDADQVLKTDGSGVLSWVDQASGGGGFTYSAITADPAPAVKDTHYSCTGTFTITLPAVSGTTAGDQIRVKNIGTGTVTIDGASSETVDGATTFAMDVQWSAVTLVSNGSTGWEIV